MSSAGWKPSLRYSPVNAMIVDWGINGVPFSMGCMPAPVCPGPDPVPPAEDCCDSTMPLTEAVDTYDWHRWVPEIIAGLENTVDDMAAAYARTAAIEFARKTRVLKRQIAIRLQKGILRYPLDPFEDESVQGVLRVETKQGTCACDSEMGPVDIGVVSINIARQELQLQPRPSSCGCHINDRGPDWILVTVWVAPTESSCQHDVFLYEQYRHEITLGARAAFMKDAHSIGVYMNQRGVASFRGDQFMYQRALQLQAEFMQSMRNARRDAVTDSPLDTHAPASLFGHSAYFSRRR